MIRLDVVTPQGRVVENLGTESVVLPGAQGEIEVLSGHAELLTLLKPGVLRFHDHGKERKFAVSYGFAEVHRDHVTVLAETCEEAHTIDSSRARKAREKAQAMLQGSLDQGQFRKYQLKLERAIIRESIAS